MDTKFGATIPFGTMRSTSERLAGRESLISTWRSAAAGRVFYDEQASLAIDNKLVKANLGPKLHPLLLAGDPEGTGFCHKQHLLEVCMLHFGLMLTSAEQQCLISEWQVMDHITGQVDYDALCKHASLSDAMTMTVTSTEATEAPADDED